MAKQIFLFTLLLHTMSVYSQSTLSYNVTATPSQNPVNNFDTVYSFHCFLTIPDTSNVSYILVKMGTNLGWSNVVDHDFEYDVDAGLPSGLDYVRSGNEITLSLGNRTMDSYFLQVSLKDTSNNVSSPILWNNN
ncbi:MAG: hypothetical protein RIE58_07825 [Vicingaceae bacterium]